MLQKVHLEMIVVLVVLTSVHQLEASPKTPAPSAVLEIHYGFTPRGSNTAEWQVAIRDWHTAESLESLAHTATTVTEDESEWMALIEQRVHVWSGMIDSLRIPFNNLPPPDTIIILLGNRGGNDAFIPAPLTICFDLSRLYSEYGRAVSDVNRERIDRFFAHEFTHLLHSVWAARTALQVHTPLDVALWECLKEGLGNYRSLNKKWMYGNGELTENAVTVLRRLEPVFVERLVALDRASENETQDLLQGLSMGPFEQKWGALTVALWLAQEAKGDDRNLRQWVDKGPGGILELARKYLPQDLKGRLPGIE